MRSTHHALAIALVLLAAIPSADSTFAGWSGGCSGTGVCNVTMSADRNVTATFNRIVEVQPVLTVTVTPDAGGSVDGNPIGIACGTGNTLCSHAWNVGTLIAAPGGDATGCSSTHPTIASITVTLSPQPIFGRAWFSNLDSALPPDDRIGQIALDARAHSGWAESKLTLPPERALTVRTVERASRYVTE